MPLPSPQPADNQTIIVVVLIFVGFCVAYWRTAGAVEVSVADRTG